MDHIEELLSTDAFMPHGMCYLWQPAVLTLHVASDSLIALAYFTIPFTLLYFVRRRTDLQFSWMFVCFAIFIVACGTTHLMEVWTVWHPTYWLTGAIKAITALASVPTAALLIKLVPVALRVPSPAALSRANSELEREVAERRRAQDQLHRVNEQLERRVAERTAQLEASNQQLLREQQAQAQLAAIVQSSDDAIISETLDGHISSWNGGAQKLFGYTAAEVLGQPIAILIPPDRLDEETDILARLQRGEAIEHLETLRRCKDGRLIEVSVTISPMRNDRGELIGTSKIARDITERRHTDRKLREHLAKLDLLSRTTRAIGERQDLHSILQVAIRSLEQDLPIDFGCVCLYDASQPALTVACVGMKSHPFALPLAMPEKAQIEIDPNGLSRCVSGQLVYEPDLTRIAFPFAQRLARAGLGSLVAAPLIIESKVFGVVLAARREVEQFDSSDCEFLRQLSEHLALALHQAELYSALQRAYEDLRQTQQSVMQQERLRVLGQLASGIAHDINNSLSPAGLYTQLLLERDTTLSTEAKQYLAVIQQSLESVAHTVARMKEFYRRREPQLAPVLVHLNRILQQVLDLTRARWSAIPQERGIVIRTQTELAPDLPPIGGDEGELRDAFTNLILNAVDAMPGGGTLTVRTRAIEGGQVCVEVLDTGIGMDEATRTRCLEPFFTTKGERGSGLGLAMVYGMLERHGGRVEIDSQLGEGTAIRLIFPPAIATTPEADGSGVFPRLRPSQPLRILFVDDDPILLKSLRDTLEQDGHVVVVADGGQRGIDTFRAAQARGERFATVITDLGMPYVDGRTVARAIKSAAPDVPVILLTGWGHRLLAENDRPECVDRVLSKPPKLAALRLALAELTTKVV